MAALSPFHLPCPSCGSEITIPASATPGERRGNSLAVKVSADDASIREHVEQHREA